MKYDEFWNATLPEAIASIDGYLKRNEDFLRGIRKVCWFTVLPWLESNQRGTEFDVFLINGDPTAEELEAARLKEQQEFMKMVKEFRQEAENKNNGQIASALDNKN